ncbi:hypothetical protein H7K28_09790 [Paenibacillus polymyxa]|jgi:hypothetical protein|uniref:hypothetical protein n=1 Tax=Paenibacillus TaxID=44249 RepID=UPI000D301F31|nr:MULTISPECIES: hypothetical protein [Paenibacillus]KAF6617368.1 hypothetical protein HFE00_13785 [Paenibacillus sp. EKM101P]KAF6622142.1 hypothetical protein HFE03_13600 [Paenibacillus sp. EKM102P]KAF6631306.1 hypothetical protein HFE01_13355 [Paenibacillus sp. EKM10P]KAF6650384.1 hypothetical protein HFE02_05620 [Paenibacillus sp. EKM11P]MBY0022696.1 hypothetical protein [Paenibacillus polymyxa]
MELEDKVRRYYQLKQKQKEIEGELADLRNDITAHCAEKEGSDWEIGNYRVRIVQQHRKEYDHAKLYDSLPDPQLWRLFSKPDTSKISSLLKLKVIAEEQIKDAVSLKTVTLLQVDKK